MRQAILIFLLFDAARVMNKRRTAIGTAGVGTVLIATTVYGLRHDRQILEPQQREEANKDELRAKASRLARWVLLMRV